MAMNQALEIPKEAIRRLREISSAEKWEYVYAHYEPNDGFANLNIVDRMKIALLAIEIPVDRQPIAIRGRLKYEEFWSAIQDDVVFFSESGIVCKGSKVPFLPPARFMPSDEPQDETISFSSIEEHKITSIDPYRFYAAVVEMKASNVFVVKIGSNSQGVRIVYEKVDKRIPDNAIVPDDHLCDYPVRWLKNLVIPSDVSIADIIGEDKIPHPLIVAYRTQEMKVAFCLCALNPTPGGFN